MASVNCPGTVSWTLIVMCCLLVPTRGSSHSPGEIDGPCMGCRLFNFHHRQHPEEKEDTVFCHYPCQCPIELIDCKRENRSEIKDGCGCCYMCAKQLNEACSVKESCDSAKELYCDRKDDKSYGVCKGTHRKNPCFVNGVTYEDGETFAPDCSQVCTCQNGFYGCSSRCPHEFNKPSEETCHNARLMKVKNECCREWTCQKLEYNGTSIMSSRRGLRSQSLMRRHVLSHITTTIAPPTTTLAPPPGVAGGPCPQSSQDWTPCSVSCGIGHSVRTIVDPVTCASARELRMCLLRPCNETFDRPTCTATVKSKERKRILYQDCISIKKYRLRYCDTCRKRKCCFPKRTRLRKIEFQCSQGKREVYNFMWIKKCQCAKTCYGKVESKSKRRRARERKKKRRARERAKRQRALDESKKRREQESGKKRQERQREKSKKTNGREQGPKRRDKKRSDKRGKRRKTRKQ